MWYRYIRVIGSLGLIVWYRYIRAEITNPWITIVQPVASKILEKAVQTQLLRYLHETSQLSPFQCGFRRNHSTQDAVTYFTDCIRRGIDDGCLTAAVFVDLRKAFDSVNHNLLLNKMAGYGITNHELHWFENYLSDRNQSVMYGNVLSTPLQMKSGVPQGSILGPILFSIYINDLPDCLHQSNILMYADDAVIFYTNPSIEEIKSVLKNDLENLQTWTSCYKLCIHPVKTEYVLFGTQQRLSSAERLNLYLGDKIIKQVQHYEYLGGCYEN